MKPTIYNLIICFLSLAFVTSNAFANDHFGVCYYGNQTVDHIVCTGPTVVNEVTVKTNMNVAGSLRANKCTVGTLTINGSVTMNDSTIKGATTIVGELNATGVKFNDNVSITAKQARLNHVTINGSITMISTDPKPVLLVQCGTLITGSVIFKGTKGWVQMSNDALVQGKVENATIEFVSRQCD